jgi:prepilin-type processing-associated H-X9-DG protein
MGRIPDGRQPLQAYPNGANGGVSTANAGKSNFAFTDGHAKTMTPAATDPDPINQRDKNLWNGLR